MRNYLDFEKEIKNLEEDLETSKNPFDKEGISEVDTNKIKIEGTKSLSGTSHRFIYDFVEAFTFVVFSGATKASSISAPMRSTSNLRAGSPRASTRTSTK